MKITHKNSMNGAIKGEHNDYTFSAKVYEESSKHGINSGRVSKFDLIQDGQIIAYYDRDWGSAPESEVENQTVQEIVGYIDSMKRVW